MSDGPGVTPEAALRHALAKAGDATAALVMVRGRDGGWLATWSDMALEDLLYAHRCLDLGIDELIRERHTFRAGGVGG